MTNTYLLIALTLLHVIFLVAFFRRRSTLDPETLCPHFDNVVSLFVAESRRLEASLRDEFTRQRTESSRDSQALREEVGHRVATGLDTLLQRQSEAHRATEQRLEGFRLTLENQLRVFGESSDTRLGRLRQELNDSSTLARSEMNQQFEKIRLTVEGKLGELQTRNEQKLEEMRKTVDEKLEGTLNQRLGEQFKHVSEKLDLVHKAFGEMQSMANSVGDLKKVLTNVKTRGTWGEIQLGNLLEQVLSPEQYSSNIAPKPGSSERVEFAIRLPGRNGETEVWLPIDSKFPQEDYHRVIEASEAGDVEALASAGKALETRLRDQARDIRDKYISPPHTTDFAILFLPSEGLYAEALRRPGLSERLQVENRVMIAGPTTLAALLNSLQMGFRTLAIQQRSSEVWNVLGAVKTEFGKYGELLAKVKKKLDEASNQIEATERRARAINKQLRSVEALPADQAAQILPAENLLAEDSEVENAEPSPLFDRIPNIDK